MGVAVFGCWLGCCDGLWLVFGFIVLFCGFDWFDWWCLSFWVVSWWVGLGFVSFVYCRGFTIFGLYGTAGF